MGVGAIVLLATTFQLFALSRNFFVKIGELGTSAVKLGTTKAANAVGAGGITKFSVPDVSAAYIGVGYIIGPEVAAMNFAGAVLAWGFMVPLLVYFLGPQLQHFLPPGTVTDASWDGTAMNVWKFIVRPIAVGGMLVGAGYTMFRMRQKISAGLARAIGEFRTKETSGATVRRTERYMSSKTVFGMIGIVFIGMAILYVSFAGVTAGLTAAVVMLIAGFFFCTVSGYLVGMIGSSNNPISGLTLSTLIVAALLMVALGVSGTSGVIAVLGVAAVVCVAAAVAGELLQDFKVGWILGGTPRTIQIVELVAVVVAAAVMYFPLLWLHKGNIAQGGTGFGDPKLSAPQASLMAFIAQGIVGGDMAWPLVITGILMGFAMIMFKVRSPMLVAIGMYLPIGTTSAIFIGGMIRWVTDTIRKRRTYNEAQTARIENVGVLVASGMIAGEALSGLVIGWFNYQYGKLPSVLEHPSYLLGVVMIALLALTLIRIPLANAGDPNEPAPPSAIM
jgi:putative OPT family oligopeptide transporter